MSGTGEFTVSEISSQVTMSLPEEKRRLIEKYSLVLTERMIWITVKENSFPRKICRHTFMEKSDILGLLFRINEICFAKVNYFRSHISSFIPLKYHYTDGFVPAELWDADFLKHRVSGLIFDFRYLNSIKEIDRFRELCADLEKLENIVTEGENC